MKLVQALLVLLLCVSMASAVAAQKQKSKKGKKKAPVVEEVHPLLVPGLRAELKSVPAEVEVGEPMRWTVEIHHPKELIPLLPGEDLGLGSEWVVLEDYGATTEASPDGIDEVGFWITRKSWQVVALRKAKVLPSLEIFFGEGSGALSVLTSEGELVVQSLLGPGEPFARPRRTFRDPLQPVQEERTPWWLIAPGVSLVLVVGWWLFARKRRGPKSTPRVAPLAQLESMGQELPDDLQSLQSLHYSLTSLVREATEERLGTSFSGTTDEEWLDLVRSDARVRGDVEEQLSRVFESAQSVKYARIKPSQYAVEETLSAAREVIESMGSVPGGKA